MTWSGIKWAFSAHLLFPSAYADYYQPLTFLSRMLDLQLHGTHAGGHHVTNLLLHAINSALVFWVLKRMTGEFSAESDGRDDLRRAPAAN
ncbi:MAG: hypothetical protein M3463_08980 [Verrucomicrobiota bacterium]|nr:hypothetical protein [Verrucomicrobiota bacterium]